MRGSDVSQRVNRDHTSNSTLFHTHHMKKGVRTDIWATNQFHIMWKHDPLIAHIARTIFSKRRNPKRWSVFSIGTPFSLPIKHSLKNHPEKLSVSRWAPPSSQEIRTHTSLVLRLSTSKKSQSSKQSWKSPRWNFSGRKCETGSISKDPSP